MSSEPPEHSGESPPKKGEHRQTHDPVTTDSPGVAEHTHHNHRHRRGDPALAIHCAACHRRVLAMELSHGALHGSALNQYISEQIAGWQEDQPICHRCLNRFRAGFVAHTIAQERGELTQLEEEVIRSLQEQAIISENINTQFDQSLTRGQIVADRVAAFGGSWTFIGLFSLILAGWIIVNSRGGSTDSFDPYPFILLNLLLSCIAAMQAPIIMMSQNRQEAKDRCRSEQDYLVNLKAELEIRHLSRKLDQLMSHQWQRLLEVQNIQTELLEELFELQRRLATGRHSERRPHESVPIGGRSTPRTHSD